MIKSELLKDALYGVLYFATVVGLIKLVQPHGPWAVVGVLYTCTFCLYWFFYKIRDIKHYLTSFAVLGGILLAFYVAGKAGVAALILLYIAVPIWILYSRREKLKEGYVEFETAADKVFGKVEEKKEKKVVKAKKPSRSSNKNPRKHKQKRETRKKNTSKTSKPRTVKKRSKDSGKKTTSN
jgi:hypothetical protein|tara:strand:+ start:1192 stop:1734 length:543 start_codon:yes stop_codon:yes gene_type:complete